jgi:5-formyltetrahydrofolate cyclo-ligase
MSHPDDLRNLSKADLRHHFKAVRDTAAAECNDAAISAVQHFQSTIKIPEDAVVAGYWPMRNEFDPRPLMVMLGEAGHTLALPVVTGKDLPLVFRDWTPGNVLVEGGFGTQVPPASAREVVPDLALIPMLAFDTDGYRLGYGGGFYDRTLSGVPMRDQTVAVGLAFAAQETEFLPREAHDQKLHWIVTEQGTRTFV